MLNGGGADNTERVDVVVVGARLAGCAAAAPLARAGKRVLVLDKMSFPSDQLSTHVLLPAGTSELAKLGALPRILALKPSRVKWVELKAENSYVKERFRPAEDGIDFGVCVPRDLQDVELVEAVREQGGEVRERCTVTSLIWRAGRVAGLRYRDDDGADHEVSADLVIGADGRRSSVAAMVGSWDPYRVSRNGRGLVFRYMDDPQAGTIAAQTYSQYREGDSIAFAFPTTPEGRLLILMMGHRDEASEARKDPEAYWQRKLDQHPRLRDRQAGATNLTKLRSTGETPAFFRASSGPGWALAGDAGHFKDPVTGQGMRDALWAGRTLAEAALPHLGSPHEMDVAIRAWEAERDRECMHAYHFANSDTRVEVQSPALCEVVREAGRNEDADLSDLFGRGRTYQEIVPLPRAAKAFVTALVRGERPRSETITRGIEEARIGIGVMREIQRDRFRTTRTVPGSDHPDAVWPDPPRVAPQDAAPASEEAAREEVTA